MPPATTPPLQVYQKGHLKQLECRRGHPPMRQLECQTGWRRMLRGCRRDPQLMKPKHRKAPQKTLALRRGLLTLHGRRRGLLPATCQRVVETGLQVLGRLHCSQLFGQVSTLILVIFNIHVNMYSTA